MNWSKVSGVICAIEELSSVPYDAIDAEAIEVDAMMVYVVVVVAVVSFNW